MQSDDKSLAQFLEAHGLQHYAELLAEHAVDLDILPSLSHEELKELGLPLGDRRKLMAAVSDLEREVAASGRAAERRHVTVLFCDVVGSTELAHRLDPEDFSDLLRTYAERTAAAITRFQGHVAKYMGDGVLAFFGFPNAHEDDAERAILAALDLLRIHRETPIMLEGGGKETLRVRIGIHTGEVVVGSFEGGPGAKDDIFGEAPNIAQRLLLAATPEEIVVSSKTRRLAGSRFEYSALEPRVLRGLAEPIKPFSVLREYVERTRFETRKSGALTPFVGRAHDIERLIEHWAAARAGSGQAVMISGPAGVGKSRLANAFFDVIRAEAKQILTVQCSPHHVGTALYPVIVWLHQETGLSSLEPGQSKSEALGAWLERHGSEADLALIASLLSVEVEDMAPPLDMTPRQRMDETLRFLTDYISGLSRAAPVLLLVEDVHWADPTTLRLVELVRASSRDLPVMMIATFRTGTEQSGISLQGAAHCRLDRLSRSEMASLVVQAAGSRDIDAKLVRAIVERSEGIPLFAEELMKAVLERHADDRGPGEALHAGEILVPDSLVDSLSARLDALPNAKYLAQVAASIGREVPQGLLRTVSGYNEARFRRALRELADAQMILAYPEDAADPLVFGHALIQDVAYNLMLRRDRRRIHARVAEVLEAGRQKGRPPLPEILARHYEACGQISKAVRNLIEAGRKAISQSANIEALQHLEHAGELVAGRTGMSEEEALRLELEIQSAIGVPLIAVKGYTSRETVRAFDRAEEIAASLGDVHSRFHALFGLWGHRWMAGHLDMSQRIAAEMLDIAQEHPMRERSILAHRCAGSSYWIAGNCEAALGHLDRVIELTRDFDTAELAGSYAVCPHVVALVLGGYGQWLSGAREAGLERLQRGHDRAYRMNHPYSKALSHSLLGGLAWLSGEADELADHAEKLKKIAEERRFPYWKHYAQTLEGALLGMRGEYRYGREMIEEAIDAYDSMGVHIHRTVQLIILSDIEWRAGRSRQSARLLDEAEALGNRTGERQWFCVLAELRAREPAD